ncbi:hypothetical protein FQA47_013285 [Oryzias melastigma]|uniref:Uncharacterized protein n=1 Tax=Oryzias melastigma TaxID=30732 RepID=A0A834F5K4_ORYME|nr:hypothetical protein FQA47_013285 [Oryzias melastigma]
MATEKSLEDSSQRSRRVSVIWDYADMAFAELLGCGSRCDRRRTKGLFRRNERWEND